MASELMARSDGRNFLRELLKWSPHPPLQRRRAARIVDSGTDAVLLLDAEAEFDWDALGPHQSSRLRAGIAGKPVIEAF
jgi:hypothetical protein